MTNILEFCREYGVEFVTALIALMTAIAGVIATIQTRKFKNYLDAAKQRETYIECPKCKKRIPLSEIHFHLPSGELDDDLNGKADSQE